MAYAKQTLNDLLLSFSYRYGESSVPSSGINNRKYWLNRGVDYIVRALRLTKSLSVTVTSGVCDLSSTATGVALDFRSFVKLTDASGCEYQIINKEEYALAEGAYCCITGDHGTGYTLNVKTDGTYTLYYEFNISPMTNLTDECIISDPEAVVAYAYAQIRMSETDPLQDASKNLEECNSRIKEMAQEMARNEGDLKFKSLY